MEEGYLRKIKSPVLETPPVKKALEVLLAQVDAAEEYHDKKAASNVLVKAAIKIVEEFLKTSGRICYGGQAINAHLPDELKFYDPKNTIPDYDVYTPHPEKDLRLILKKLRAQGFPEVEQREGIHKGTIKVSVAYNDILDLTFMDTDIYNVLYKRSKVISNIHYADVNFLRSNMYKELALPESEISRWEKVYTRLALLNDANPVEQCEEPTDFKNPPIPKSLYHAIFQYIIANKRILAGANISKIYKKASKNYSWLLNDTSVPIIFFSSQVEEDVKQLMIIAGANIRTEIIEAHSDVVPKTVIIYKDDTLIGIVVEAGGCYSYNKIVLENGSSVLIASMDVIIRLFYQLSLLANFPPIAEISLHCIAQNLVDISVKIRSGVIQSKFPLFSIECVGHEKTKGSLIRDKRLRKRIRKVARLAAGVTRKRQRAVKKQPQQQV